MATGLAAATANAILDSLCRGVAWTPPDAVHIQLHVGDPGAAGTANPADETTRVEATFATPATGGGISNTAAVSWTSVSAAEDVTHFSAWDAATDGDFQFSGEITANAVMVGDGFSIPVGDLDVSLTVAA